MWASQHCCHLAEESVTLATRANALCHCSVPCTNAFLAVLVQTLILMSDLATALDVQGRYDEAYTYVKRAAELAKQTKHPEEHVVLNNLAGILMHKGNDCPHSRLFLSAGHKACA